MALRRQRPPPPDSPVVATWRRDDVRRIRVVVLLGFALGFAVLALLAGLRGNASWAFAFGDIALLELGLAGCFSIWTNRSSVVLTTTEVVNRVGRHETRVSLDEIRGVIVGGTYRRGWATWLLLDGRESVRLAAPAFAFHDRTKVFGEKPPLFWRRVAESPSGRQAVRIQAAVGIECDVKELMREHPLRGELTRWWSTSGVSSSSAVYV